MKHKTMIFLATVTLIFASCSNDSDDDLRELPDNADVVTYDADIRPLLQNNCIGCHSDPPVNGAPFALVNFSQVSSRSSAILNAMSRQSGAARAMPPSGRLPQSTIDLVDEWIKDGLKEN